MSFVVALLVLTMGGSALFLGYAQLKVMKEGPSQLGQHVPGARRRAVVAGVVLVLLIGMELGLWRLGVTLSGPGLGGALVIAGIIVIFVGGFVASVWDDARRRPHGNA